MLIKYMHYNTSLCLIRCNFENSSIEIFKKGRINFEGTGLTVLYAAVTSLSFESLTYLTLSHCYCGQELLFQIRI
jgi:hypothetical protein